MDFIDLMNIILECYKSLPCDSKDCDIVIDFGDENCKLVNHVELRHTEDCKHAILVFYHDDF